MSSSASKTRRIPGTRLGSEKDRASALVLQPNTVVKEGMFVGSSGIDLSVDVSEEMLGRIVDAFLGQPLDGGKGFKKTKNMEIEKIAPGVMTRQSVDTPVRPVSSLSMP